MKSPIKLISFGFVKKTLAIGVFCLFFLPLNAFAKTLAEYRVGIESVQTSTEDLIDYVDEVSDDSDLKDVDYERETLADIRKTLPVTEKIEWQGTSVETGNQWLEAKLKAFEDEASDQTKRRLILTDINERLAALEKKIKQLEDPSMSDRSKDEDKQKLAEILRRTEYQKPPEKQESWFQKMMKQIRAWFNEKFPRPDIPAGAANGLQTISFGFQMLLYAVVFGFIAFLLYRFAPFFVRKFRQREKEDKDERVILGEKLAANEDSQSLFSEAEALARNGNLRGAIRKGYIALLCELSDRKIIGLAQHKTNRDYLRDVRKKRELHQNMNGLTNSFERHWYGFDDADESDWNEFKQIYQKAVSSEQG
jgi:Domain of unknown function (DUF4129)